MAQRPSLRDSCRCDTNIAYTPTQISVSSEASQYLSRLSSHQSHTPVAGSFFRDTYQTQIRSKSQVSLQYSAIRTGVYKSRAANVTGWGRAGILDFCFQMQEFGVRPIEARYSRIACTILQSYFMPFQTSTAWPLLVQVQNVRDQNHIELCTIFLRSLSCLDLTALIAKTVCSEAFIMAHIDSSKTLHDTMTEAGGISWTERIQTLPQELQDEILLFTLTASLATLGPVITITADYRTPWQLSVNQRSRRHIAHIFYRNTIFEGTRSDFNLRLQGELPYFIRWLRRLPLEHLRMIREIRMPCSMWLQTPTSYRKALLRGLRGELKWTCWLLEAGIARVVDSSKLAVMKSIRLTTRYTNKEKKIDGWYTDQELIEMSRRGIC